MTSPDAASIKDVASALNEYLQTASALLLPPSSPARKEVEGWTVTSADSSGGEFGRTPWVYMSDVEVTAIGRAVVVSFRWNATNTSSPSPTYLLPMEAPNWDAVTGSDKLITQLDLLLDSPNWKLNAHIIGDELYVIVMPQKS